MVALHSCWLPGDVGRQGICSDVCVSYPEMFRFQHHHYITYLWHGGMTRHVQGLKLSLIPGSDFLLLLSKSWSKSDRYRSYFLSLKPDIWLDWVAKLCSRFDNLGAFGLNLGAFCPFAPLNFEPCTFLIYYISRMSPWYRNVLRAKQTNASCEFR